MLQISVREIHNDIILSFYQGDFFGAINDDGRVYIGDTSLINYIPKHINPIIYRNKITCGCEICMSSMLLQSDLNKLWLMQLANF